MKNTIKNGLYGLVTAGAVGLGSLAGYNIGNSQEKYSTQASTLEASAGYTQNEGRVLKEEYVFKRPKYHPSIEDFEKKLEKEVGSLVPTYHEVDEAVIGNKKEPLKNKLSKVREAPKSVQNNKYYREFLKHLEEHYKNPEEKGFLFDASVSDLIKNKEKANELEKELGFDKVNFEKPTESDKATYFLIWLADKKREKVEVNNKQLFYKVLDGINKSGRMPTKDYKNEELHLALGNYMLSVNYGFFLEDVLGVEKLEVIEDPNGTTKILRKPTPIVASSYEDFDKDGRISIDEISFDYNFDLKNEKKMVLGMYFPEKKDELKKGRIELYNPRGEKVVDSNFKFDNDSKLKKGDVNLERIVHDNGFGTYTAAFFVNDKCWQVQQIETDFEKPVLDLSF